MAEHDGVRADGLAPAVTAAVVIGAATAALRWWAEQDDGRPEDVVDRALRDLS
ncbi:hypothetical protein [Curtobacterium sp. MCJR17_043]|uniref:acyl-CoA-like ligand-binding transcription factor n=1 Tax=Curtobacterium sp. MCJR17_043 TaxID=2175660 RepID=UPI0024DF7174|nr:hypothetical protein [Curtobacterium sp. MCJR17_043]WIB36637.1 hypothetical protein DEJ15_05955 [Curtobacterium sp. MCJR17_043]